MITIRFPDRATQKEAVGFLLGRFSGHVLKTGEHLVPEAALEALAERGIPFIVQASSDSGFGSLRGKIRMADDFDSPLEDFEPYMD